MYFVVHNFVVDHYKENNERYYENKKGEDEYYYRRNSAFPFSILCQIDMQGTKYGKENNRSHNAVKNPPRHITERNA